MLISSLPLQVFFLIVTGLRKVSQCFKSTIRTLSSPKPSKPFDSSTLITPKSNSFTKSLKTYLFAVPSKTTNQNLLCKSSNSHRNGNIGEKLKFLTSISPMHCSGMAPITSIKTINLQKKWPPLRLNLTTESLRTSAKTTFNKKRIFKSDCINLGAVQNESKNRIFLCIFHKNILLNKIFK